MAPSVPHEYCLLSILYPSTGCIADRSVLPQRASLTYSSGGIFLGLIWPKLWNTYWGEVLWLWRNPTAGFCWQVLAVDITDSETFTLTDSGNGLNVDKGQGTFGWFKITSSSGYFQYRTVKKLWGNKAWTFERGWLLDNYMKDREAKAKHPKAVFQFQPQVRTVK